MSLNKSFCLWLIADAAEADVLPTTFIQECLKVTFESPPGIQSNLENSYSQIIEFKSINDKYFEKIRLKTIFILCWFHAILQERRKFIPEVIF